MTISKFAFLKFQKMSTTIMGLIFRALFFGASSNDFVDFMIKSALVPPKNHDSVSLIIEFIRFTTTRF